eukprot:s1524_g11.t1
MVIDTRIAASFKVAKTSRALVMAHRVLSSFGILLAQKKAVKEQTVSSSGASQPLQRNIIALNATGCIISKDGRSVLSNLHSRCLSSLLPLCSAAWSKVTSFGFPESAASSSAASSWSSSRRLRLPGLLLILHSAAKSLKVCSFARISTHGLRAASFASCTCFCNYRQQTADFNTSTAILCLQRRSLAALGEDWSDKATIQVVSCAPF